MLKCSSCMSSSTPTAKKMSHNFHIYICTNLRLNFWWWQLLFCDKGKLLVLKFQRMSKFAYDSWLIVYQNGAQILDIHVNAVCKLDSSWKEVQRMKLLLIGQEWLVHVALKYFKMQRNLSSSIPQENIP